MDVWAQALGVDIDSSKSAERARRRVELEEAGQRTVPGAWTPPVPRTTNQSLLSRRRPRGRDAPGEAAGRARSPVVPEVDALEGFLTDLQGRLTSLEGGAVRNRGTVVPTRSSAARAGPGGDDTIGAMPSAGLVDIYGIPQAFIDNAEQVRGTLSRIS